MKNHTPKVRHKI